MKNIISLVTCLIIAGVLVTYRVTEIRPEKPLKISEWDANGYYLYLPSILIYHDYKDLAWFPAIEAKYHVTGNGVVEAQKADNGKYAFKYLGGVAFMELPFFLAGHFIAKHSGYPPDGFSPPYQYSLAIGILLYSFLAIFILRNVLLRFFTDIVTAITLALVCLATNYIQYAAVDSGQSHAYIFLLYALVLYTTLRWHQTPTAWWAALTGYICGLATMSRPTEAIIIFIPMLWNTQTKEIARAKWAMVKAHKPQIALAAAMGFLGILPQFIYWKSATGSFVYDVGSKWEFLTPHFQVLFGFEKGWFIYTPVTIFFVIALFLNRRFAFSRSALVFCLLNIYIIIAWHDWHYGGSYSTRALVQSYPVFALPLAALIANIVRTGWRIPFYILGSYLTAVNLFQIKQYCRTIIHYNSMNALYYSHVYLNPHPTPLDMSLLDNDEVLNDRLLYTSASVYSHEDPMPVMFAANDSCILFDGNIDTVSVATAGCAWLEIFCSVEARPYLWQSWLAADIYSGNEQKHAQIRLLNGLTEYGDTRFRFDMSVPANLQHGRVKVYLKSANNFAGTVTNQEVTLLRN